MWHSNFAASMIKGAILFLTCSWRLCQGLINYGPPRAPVAHGLDFYANAELSSLLPSCGSFAGRLWFISLFKNVFAS